jgi:hypothetical protein
MNLKVFSFFGILAPLFYIIPTIIGGLLRPGYNHLSNSVSDLLVSGAPNKIYIVGPFTLYPIFLCIFGFGLFSVLKSQPLPLSSKTGLIGFILIGAVIGVLGILTMTIFPQDAMGAPMTFPGLMHLILVTLQAFGAMAAVLLIGLWFKYNGFTGYSVYSIISFALILITGILSIIGASRGFQFIGLLQRLNVGVILVWFVVIGVWFYNLKLAK